MYISIGEMDMPYGIKLREEVFHRLFRPLCFGENRNHELCGCPCYICPHNTSCYDDYCRSIGRLDWLNEKILNKKVE